ncbi:MAG TPA: radical SAM protein [Bacillota bacterium]|nr:radical SAM protein [Bacillota bacterium]HPT87898.1 radical SAM protein [Bacillota bacterium]
MGRIQQIQSFSTLDGPGSRCVIFLQGCPVGCIFCHNPDSWDGQKGMEIPIDELLRRIDRFRPFLPNPGLTISGGEPLAQFEFTMELIRQAKTEGWHVALDTSGWGSPLHFEEAVRGADLVLFSIKHPLEPTRVSQLTVNELEEKLAVLSRATTPVWIRYVLIPSWTDGPEAAEGLKKAISRIPSVEKVEILPYNSLAQEKWKKLGWDSPLFYDDIRTDEAKVAEFERLLGMRSQ